MKKGFTLIELLVVVIILGILIAIAIPRYYQGIDSSKVQAQKANIKLVQKALEVAATQSKDKTYPLPPSETKTVAEWIEDNWPNSNYHDYFDEYLKDPWTGQELSVMPPTAYVYDKLTYNEIPSGMDTHFIVYIGYDDENRPVLIGEHENLVISNNISLVEKLPPKNMKTVPSRRVVHYCVYYIDKPGHLNTTCERVVPSAY